MNEHRSFERFLADGMASEPRTDQFPDAFYDDLQREARATRQRPRWLAFLKEPPMRHSSSLAVGSPTARVAAILAATLLLLVALGAGIAGSRLLAADGPIVVDGSGSGDFETIAAAVLSADDGDEIIVRSGTYAEAVTIGAAVALRGEGAPGSVVLTGGPETRYALLLEGVDATISGLTFAGPNANVSVAGGAPTLAELVFDDVGTAFTNDRSAGRPSSLAAVWPSLTLADGTTAHVVDNAFEDGGPIVVMESAPTIEGNVLTDGPHVFLGRALDETHVVGNEIRRPGFAGIAMSGPGRYVVEDNEIHGGTVGIEVVQDEHIAGTALAPTIHANRIDGSETGMRLRFGTEATATDNELTSVESGFVLDRTDAVISGNRIEAEKNGVTLFDQGSPLIDDNDIEAGAWAVSWFGGPTPTVTGNRLCGVSGSIQARGEVVPLGDGNTGC